MQIWRVKYDLQYIVLNRIVNRIPVWTLRKLIYQYFGVRLGKEARIGIGTIVINPKGVEIGRRTIINEYCFLDGRGGLKIGRDTSISTYSKILSASHDYNNDEFVYFTKRTVIGDRVWLGIGAVVLDGSTIRNRSVIGASAVVKGDVAEDSIMVGNPARCVKKRKIKNKKYRLHYKPYFR